MYLLEHRTMGGVQKLRIQDFHNLTIRLLFLSAGTIDTNKHCEHIRLKCSWVV